MVSIPSHKVGVSLATFVSRVNNCVGENNQKFFVLFTVSAADEAVLESDNFFFHNLLIKSLVTSC